MNALRAHEADDTWPEVLPWVLLALRTQPRHDDGQSAFTALYGTEAVLPGYVTDRKEAELPELLRQLRLQPSLPVRDVPPVDACPLPPGTAWVYIRTDSVKKPLAPVYTGPFKVLRQSRNTCRLQLGDKEDTVAVARLKPCPDPSPTPAVPPRRGRPPRS